MLRLYRSLVRSKLDYGCNVYGSARKSYLQMLDPIHNQGLRRCLGAFRTSPVESWYVDAHEPCLGARRAKLSLQYASKIKSLPKHPAHNAVFDNKYMKRPSAIRTFGLRIKQFLTASNIELSDILETPSYFIVPPWCIKRPKIVLDLVYLKKDQTDASIYQQLFMEIRDRYRDYIPVYTDGSRDGNGVACDTVFPSNIVISMRLPDSASVFTAEVWAIIKALEQIKESFASKYIVFTDSLSCLQALHYMKMEHPLIGMVIRKCVFLNIAKKDIVFCWVPSHTGIKGNEKADLAAESTLDLSRAKVGVPYTDLKYLIGQYIFFTWQDDWNGAVINKLHSVKPVLGDWQSTYRRCRKDEVVLCRARIGHTHLTYSYILKKDPKEECNHFARERKDIFGRRDVVESFRFHPSLIVLFLKQIEFYYKF